MDVYSQREQRAHGTGFVGIEAETDDKIDNLEVYEALINPRESERGGAGQGGSGMMPPMMGMGGGGAAGAGGVASAAGLSSGMASQAATGAAARIGVMGGAGAAPTISGPAAASAGVGGPSLGGLGAGGGGMPGMPGGPAAAGLPADPVEEAPEAVEEDLAPEEDPPEEPLGTLSGGGGAGELVTDPKGPTPDVIAVDPAAVEQTAREWSSLASEMADISKTASQLQATSDDFGLVRQPAGPYSEVSAGIRELAGGASKEFDHIATGLNFGAQAYRDQEAQAAQSVRSAQ